MNDRPADIWARAEIESPCVRICALHPATGLCVGCLRSLDEIAAWTRMSPEARQAVMAELPARAARHRVRRGGRKGRTGDD